jgi:hypothetical protein
MKPMHLAAAVILAMTVVFSGIYAAAATAATTLAASITTEETLRHSSRVELSAMVDRASATYRTQAFERKSTTTRETRP